MPVPKKRTSKSVKGMRRSHDAIQFTSAIEGCPNCGSPKLYHHVCQACGYYKGEKIISVEG
jgi:large subunit ribosomal protein L32